MKKLLICLLMCVLLCSCPESDFPDIIGRVWLVNESNEPIYVAQFENLYTTLRPHDIPLELISEVEPADSLCFDVYNYLAYDNRPQFNDYLMQLFVFKQSTMDSYSIEEIKSMNIYDKRYILSYERAIKERYIRVIYED